MFILSIILIRIRTGELHKVQVANEPNDSTACNIAGIIPSAYPFKLRGGQDNGVELIPLGWERDWVQWCQLSLWKWITPWGDKAVCWALLFY